MPGPRKGATMPTRPVCFGLRERSQGVGVVAPLGNKGSSLPSSLPPHIVCARQGFSSSLEGTEVFT